MYYLYLIHFHQPISTGHTAQHYIGITTNPGQRITQHKKGKSARLMEIAKERGIGFDVVRMWEADSPQAEKWLKNQKHTPQFCPCCSVHPRQTEQLTELTKEQIFNLIHPLPF